MIDCNYKEINCPLCKAIMLGYKLPEHQNHCQLREVICHHCKNRFIYNKMEVSNRTITFLIPIYR